MDFENTLIEGIIIKRYKRFLADVTLKSTKEVVTAHVPNTGAMTSCWEEGWPVLLSESDNPKRKLKYTLELTHNGETYIGVNTQNPNKLVYQELCCSSIPQFAGYPTIQREKKVGESKIDFFLSRGDLPEDQLYIEVKNVTLLGENGRGLFPDAKSERGLKHLNELISLKKKGYRTAMLYIVQREDIETFSPAAEIHPEYAKRLKQACQEGVEVYCLGCQLDPSSIKIHKEIPLIL